MDVVEHERPSRGAAWRFLVSALSRLLAKEPLIDPLRERLNQEGDAGLKALALDREQGLDERETAILVLKERESETSAEGLLRIIVDTLPSGSPVVEEPLRALAAEALTVRPDERVQRRLLQAVANEKQLEELVLLALGRRGAAAAEAGMSALVESGSTIASRAEAAVLLHRWFRRDDGIERLAAQAELSADERLTVLKFLSSLQSGGANERVRRSLARLALGIWAEQAAWRKQEVPTYPVRRLHRATNEELAAFFLARALGNAAFPNELAAFLRFKPDRRRQLVERIRESLL